jgi:hypothetical protein
LIVGNFGEKLEEQKEMADYYKMLVHKLIGIPEICKAVLSHEDIFIGSMTPDIWEKVIEQAEHKPQGAAQQNTVAKGGYSKETLYHFSCHACGKWFSIGDYDPGGSVVKGYCPHCGMLQQFDEVEVTP